MSEKNTKYILWALGGISAVILLLFVLVGFDTPYEENPTFTEPVLTDLLLIWTAILTVLAIVVTCWGLFNSLTTKGTGTMKEKGLIANTGSIAWGICAASIVLGAVLGFANSGETMLINGQNFNVDGANALDIVMTDISMVAIAVLFVATLVVTAMSMMPKK